MPRGIAVPVRPFAALAIGAALVLTGCGGGGEEEVRAACAAYEKAGPQSIETVGPVLQEMATQAQAAAAANSDYQEFADAAITFQEILTDEGDDTGEDFEAQYARLIAANEVVETTCGSLD